ncbi:MAG: FprA family A-type flavoprotein [Treponema sp.]|jgi:flavorubredoxin|nr:FprA family A-type flavoprotein [Treponema sp.]
MKTHDINSHIRCLHADIHTNDLFEGIWPIPRGVSLNAFVARGDKTALIDFVRDWEGAVSRLDAQLEAAGLRCQDVDYLILNHLEPDHTGALAEFRRRNPHAQILATAKGIKLIPSFYTIDDDGLRAVRDGEALDLGQGVVLRFFETPNLHWPETMVTFEEASGTLFSCDAFGSFGALGDRVFDDEFSGAEHAFFEGECLRYYANIVSSFSLFVEKAIVKLQGAVPAPGIRCVAPSHGIVWRKRPEAIIERYARYAAYARSGGEPEVCVVWGSMYGNTKAGLDAVIKGIAAAGVPYRLHRVPDEDLSYILADGYRARGLVMAMPTYEYAMFPPMAWALDLFKRKHITGKKALRIGSWGWVGGAQRDYEAAIAGLRWESAPAIEWAGQADSATLAALEAAGKALAQGLRVGTGP